MNAVQAARNQYDAGLNEMSKGASRPSRAKAICSILQNRSVTDWVGTVDLQNSNGDGRGVLGLKIGPGMFAKTWNNSLSDISDHTLIDPSSRLFQTASSFKVGELVKFGGQFFQSETDCIEEGSVTLAGSISRPDFIFRFAEIISSK